MLKIIISYIRSKPLLVFLVVRCFKVEMKSHVMEIITVILLCNATV